MKKYNIQTLKEINISYDMEHKINESDVKMANKYVLAIEQSRNSNTPQVGDIVRYTNVNGDYYEYAHVDSIDKDKIYICERPHTPFVSFSYMDNNSIRTSTSGGAWDYIPSNLKLVGSEEKAFCDFGHCGGCANGAVTFYAKVNVWEYSENKSEYSTKDYDKFTVTIDEPIHSTDYKYFVQKNFTPYKAFRTKEEYINWLESVQGVEVNDNFGRLIVWAYKSKLIYNVEPNEFELIDGTLSEDWFNGSVVIIKSVFDHENKTVTKYFKK